MSHSSTPSARGRYTCWSHIIHRWRVRGAASAIISSICSCYTTALSPTCNCYTAIFSTTCSCGATWTCLNQAGGQQAEGTPASMRPPLCPRPARPPHCPRPTHPTRLARPPRPAHQGSWAILHSRSPELHHRQTCGRPPEPQHRRRHWARGRPPEPQQRCHWTHSRPPELPRRCRWTCGRPPELQRRCQFHVTVVTGPEVGCRNFVWGTVVTPLLEPQLGFCNVLQLCLPDNFCFVC